jgi:hypothetical protein
MATSLEGTFETEDSNGDLQQYTEFVEDMLDQKNRCTSLET